MQIKIVHAKFLNRIFVIYADFLICTSIIGRYL